MTAPELTKVNKILHRMVSGTNFKAVLTMSNYSIQKRPPEVFCKKAVLENFAKFTEKHLWQSLFFIKKETLAHVFFCEFWKISENTFSYRTAPVATSVRIM